LSHGFHPNFEFVSTAVYRVSATETLQDTLISLLFPSFRLSSILCYFLSATLPVTIILQSGHRLIKKKTSIERMNKTSMKLTSQRVNYDLIAHLYDEPGRDYETDQNLVDFLNRRADDRYSRVRILDIGCGTGKQLTANYSEFPTLHMIGLDLFYGMLKQARNRCGDIKWIQGDSANPPFANCAFDYITNQFSYHHVQDKSKMISSIFRILKPSGRFVITNLDPWSMPGWIVYTFFPAACDRDLSDFLPVDDITARLEKAGLCNAQVKYQHSHRTENLNDFLNYASQRHRTSQLMAIGQNDYDRGIAELKERVAQFGTSARISSDICLVWITSDKPGYVSKKLFPVRD
jgi:ubiquinone/menaquinone biosynthesis C-methylase UbiE